MQIILPKQFERLWLEGNLPKEELLDLLKPYNLEEMKATLIPAVDSFMVNSK